MAQSPPNKPDRHYNFRRLNMVFAYCSLIFLAVTIWMVIEDYAKPWKRFQSEFRDLERQDLEAQAAAERGSLDQNQLEQIRANIAQQETALDERRSEVKKLQKTLSQYEKKVYAADSQMRTTKSLLDTARYEYDAALQHGSDKEIAATHQEVEKLASQWREDRKQLEAFNEQRDQAQVGLQDMRKSLVEAEDRLSALRKGLDNLEQRASNLDKKLDYFMLNAPLMDIFQPDLKIEQVIVPGLYHDINFTNVQRVDRCVTCHVASNRPGFDGEQWSEPYRSHPRLDLYVGAASPHPLYQVRLLRMPWRPRSRDRLRARRAQPRQRGTTR